MFMFAIILQMFLCSPLLTRSFVLMFLHLNERPLQSLLMNMPDFTMNIRVSLALH